ncbi:MAG: hypothetical protein ACOYMN_05720 [Roseimicrobium sp.]
MASQAGVYNTLSEPSGFTLFPVHNPETSTPGLPVKAATILYAGCMAAYDPANARCEAADPTIAATSIVVGVMQETVDNSAGILGALKARPQAGIFRLKNDGNLTSAHLFKRVRVVDDHTVGVPAGTDADRFAGILLGLEGGTGYAWVLIAPGVTHDRAPVTVTLTSTNGTAGAAADLAALKAEGEKIGDDVRAIHAALVTLGYIAPAA